MVCNATKTNSFLDFDSWISELKLVSRVMASLTIDTVHSVDVKHFRPLPKVLKHSLQRMTRTQYPEFPIAYGIYCMDTIITVTTCE